MITVFIFSAANLSFVRTSILLELVPHPVMVQELLSIESDSAEEVGSAIAFM